MEYLLVTFACSRTVYIDGEPYGQTNALIEIDSGTHRIDLGTPKDYTPSFRRPTVQDTSPDEPMEVSFDSD